MSAKPHTSCSFDHPADWPCPICSPAEPTEQTAGPSVLDVLLEWFDEGVAYEVATALFGCDIDVDAPVARLVEDLAIAARARACRLPGFAGEPGPVTTPTGKLAYADTLLAYLLNGEQPHV